MYNLTGFDVCEEVYRKPLSELSYKVVSTRVPKHREYRAECVLEMRNPADKKAELTVLMYAPPSIAAAVSSHHDSREETGTKLWRDGDIEGIGDEAFGKSGHNANGTQNLLGVRSENLVLLVYLSLEDEPNAKRKVLAPKVLTIAKELLSAARRN